MRVAIVVTGIITQLVGIFPQVAAAQQTKPSGGAHLVKEAPPIGVVEQQTEVIASTNSAVRSADPVMAAHVAEACQRSSSFRALVSEIAESGGIVYINAGPCPVGAMRGCLLHVVNDTGGVRYLWVVVRASEHPIDVMSTIAHELQHAAEILVRPEIRSGWDILQYYRSPDGRDMGVRRSDVNVRNYETEAAVRAGETVRAELGASQPIDELGCDLMRPRPMDNGLRDAR